MEETGRKDDSESDSDDANFTDNVVIHSLDYKERSFLQTMLSNRKGKQARISGSPPVAKRRKRRSRNFATSMAWH
jgi:hypothetical protein